LAEVKIIVGHDVSNDGLCPSFRYSKDGEEVELPTVLLTVEIQVGSVPFPWASLRKRPTPIVGFRDIEIDLCL